MSSKVSARSMGSIYGLYSKPPALETIPIKICYNSRPNNDPGTATIPIIIATEDNQASDHLRGVLQTPEQERPGNRTSGEPESQTGTWRGFVFNVGQLSLAAPCADGLEVVSVRELSPVPMAQDWIRGMQSIHGEIYTVVDFAAFIGLAPTPVAWTCNLLALPDAGLKSALLIAGRISTRSFSSALPLGDCGQFHVNLNPYLSAVVVDQGQQWGVVDVDALCGSRDFVQIGLY